MTRDIVRAGEAGPATERRYVRTAQPLPLLGAHVVAALDAMLADNAKLAKGRRLTYRRMLEELRAAGYTGGYDAVRRYGRAWAGREGQQTAAAFVPLSFAPGEAYQFDWSYEHVVLDGVTTPVKLAQVRLCHSRMLFVRAYLREAQEKVFDAHEEAFAFFKGVPQRGIVMRHACLRHDQHEDRRGDGIRRQGAQVQPALRAADEPPHDRAAIAEGVLRCVRDVALSGWWKSSP